MSEIEPPLSEGDTRRSEGREGLNVRTLTPRLNGVLTSDEAIILRRLIDLLPAGFFESSDDSEELAQSTGDDIGVRFSGRYSGVQGLDEVEAYRAFRTVIGKLFHQSTPVQGGSDLRKELPMEYVPTEIAALLPYVYGLQCKKIISEEEAMVLASLICSLPEGSFEIVDSPAKFVDSFLLASGDSEKIGQGSVNNLGFRFARSNSRVEQSNLLPSDVLGSLVKKLFH